MIGRNGAIRSLGVKAAAAFLAATAMTVALIAPIAGAAPVRTHVHVFHPWGPKGALAPGMHVASTSSGYCWGESIAVAGEYRCMAGNGINDPCWAKPYSKGRVVGCVLEPWDKGVHVIRMTKKLPKVAKPKSLTSTRFAWAIELSSGMLCSLAQGTEALIEHKAMPYWCRKGAAGEINRSSEPWRTQYSRSDRHGPLHGVVIAQAWF